jgi:hypothetical protein
VTHAEARVDRLAALEARLVALEDERAIRVLIARYCYMADGKRDDDLVSLFTADAVMGSKTDGTARAATGREAIRAQVADPDGHHRPDLYGHGLHLLGENLVVALDGDRAMASSYSVLVLRRYDGFVIYSASSNEWALRKVDGEWFVAARHRRPVADEDFGEVLLFGRRAGYEERTAT